ncbi:MAG: MBL fold metallo-hydrolase, partial [Thermodesulfobacteriota bacterium]|nr:MBL fold metallo-hydrolase [Thermodesulfobacteriota bacterium]
DIAHVFLTHAHSDHAGGVMALANQCKAKIWAHPLEAPRLDGRHYRFLNDTLPGLLHRLGADKQTAQDMQTSLKVALQVYRRQILDNFIPLSHGLRLPVQGLDLKVIHTPGHTQGGVCFFDKRHGLLFTGDTLLPGGPAQAAMAPGDNGLPFLDGQIGLEKSLAKLSSLEACVVLSGHGPPAALDALVSMTGKGYETLRASVLEVLSAGLTPYELTRKRSRGRSPLGLYMELGHVRAVLEALLSDGLVRLETKDGLERFFPA